MLLPSGWLVVAIESNLAWPEEEKEIEYEDRHFFLRPESEDTSKTVGLRFGPDEIDNLMGDAHIALRRFLSALSWKKGVAIREATWAAGGHHIGIGKPGRVPIVDPNFWPGPLPEFQNVDVQLALALYREALSVKSIPFQFLGMYKIINTLRESGQGQKDWINKVLVHIHTQEAIDRCTNLRSTGEDVADYLYVSGRCAIAHAYSNPVVNPENAEDLERLELDFPLIKELAEYAIRNEYGVAR